MISILLDGTVTILTESDAIALAENEAEHNFRNYYDSHLRTILQKKQDIKNGKIAECAVFLHLANKYRYQIVSGLSYMSSCPDLGHDFIVRNPYTHVTTKLQIKSTNEPKYYSIYSDAQLHKLLQFDGKIVIYDLQSKSMHLLEPSFLADRTNIRQSLRVGCKWYIETKMLKKI